MFILVYSIHLDFPFPFHTDEWQHLAQSVDIIDKGYGGINPYFKEQPERKDLELGFHLFLSEFFLVTGMDPILHYKWLPALFAAIAAFILFVFINKISNFITAIFAVIFFASLRSNTNILGLWFFVPLTLAIPLAYLIFSTFSEFLEKNNIKFLFVSAFILFAMLFIHGISAIFVISVLLLYLIVYSFSKPEKIRIIFKNFKKHLLPLSLLTIVLLFTAITFLWKGSFSATLELLESVFIFRSGWTYYEKAYSLAVFYGPLASFLALFSLFSVIKDSRQRIFLLWAGLTLIIVFFFNFYKVSFILPYQRAVYYAFLGLASLSAFGLSSILDFLKKSLKSNIVFLIVSILLASFVFYNSFSPYYELEKDVQLYHNIEKVDYEAIKWFESNIGSYNVVLALPHISSTIYPISKNYVIAITPLHLIGGPAKEAYAFFKEDCDYKNNFLNTHRPDYILSQHKIYCGNLEEIYANQDYIYKVLY